MLHLKYFFCLVLSGNHLDGVEENKLPDFVDYEAYDAEVFKCAQTKPRPQILTPGNNPYTRNRGIEREDCRIERFLKKEKLIDCNDDNPAKNSKKRIKVSMMVQCKYFTKINFHGLSEILEKAISNMVV